MGKKLIFSVILVVGVLYSCKVDNYKLPDKILIGNVIDQVTGENIQTRQPNGIKIRLIEEGFIQPVPFDFWAKSDGSFRNTRLFAGKYSVIAIEGAFEDSSVDTVKIDLQQDQTQTIEFDVEPYIRLKNVNISSVIGGTIEATYNIELTTSTKDPVSSFLICDPSIILHESTSGVKKSTENNLKAMAHPDITSKTFSDQIVGLTAGTYYARVAVLTDNPLNRYNYSSIIKLVVQ